jgi:hypothetical protein
VQSPGRNTAQPKPRLSAEPLAHVLCRSCVLNTGRIRTHLAGFKLSVSALCGCVQISALTRDHDFDVSGRSGECRGTQ